jgi:hypothetical protein
MEQKRRELEGIFKRALLEKVRYINKLFLKRNAEIRKMTSGDFKFQRWLAIQKEFDGRVKEFEEMVKDLC